MADFASTVKVHSEISVNLDYDHATALKTVLSDCTDEQLVAEIARRKIDLQHTVTAELVKKSYHIDRELGHGASGKVYLVYHRQTGEGFACKVIEKNKTMNDLQSMTTEIEIMKRIRHQHVVSLFELFESPICMWLILELVEGSGLRGVLASTKHYSEEVASRFIRQTFIGIHYLHNQGVVHRDLKIDNLLLHGDVETGMVKIADFGLSALIKPGTKGYHLNESQKRKDYVGLTDKWGTATHFSPELIGKAYGPQSDIWSIGCMMYEMLTGFEAFPPSPDKADWKEHKDLYRRIKGSLYDKTRLKNMTPDANDLLMKLLEVDPTKRLTASEALAHPWLIEEDDTVDESRGLSRPRSSSVLQVDSTFRESFSRPTPPRKLPEAYKDSTRSGHHGLGIFKYMFGALSFDDKNKTEKDKVAERKPVNTNDEKRKSVTDPKKAVVSFDDKDKRVFENKNPAAGIFSDDRDKSKTMDAKKPLTSASVNDKDKKEKDKLVQSKTPIMSLTADIKKSQPEVKKNSPVGPK